MAWELLGSDLGRPNMLVPYLAVTVTVLPRSFSMPGCQVKPVSMNAFMNAVSKAALESSILTFEPT